MEQRKVASGKSYHINGIRKTKMSSDPEKKQNNERKWAESTRRAGDLIPEEAEEVNGGEGPFRTT